MPDDLITDDEILYRRILDRVDHYTYLSDGTIRISSQAFYQSTLRPSVDRAKLRNYDPTKTLGSLSGGVISLVAGDIRAIGVMHKDQKFRGEVESMPILDDPIEPDNDAHAEIYTIPDCNKPAFRKFIEQLGILANKRPPEIKPPIR